MLMSHMAKHLGETNDSEMAERFLQKSQQANMRASLVRQAVMSHETLSQEKIINPDGYE